MPIEGEIKIAVEACSGQVNSVMITSTRPLHITQIFAKKSIHSVSNLLNTVYQLCNTAHQFAFLRLLDKTNVIQLSQNEKHAYQLLLELEIIREHCFSIATKWNQSPNKKIDIYIYIYINILSTIKEISNVLFQGSNPFSLKNKNLESFSSIKPLMATLEIQLIDAFLGDISVKEEFFPFLNLDNFTLWLQNSTCHSANFLNDLKDRGFAQIGHVEAKCLPKIDQQDFNVLMQNPNFIKQPEYQRQAFETTPLSRQFQHPLIRELSKSYGNGLLTRSVAQLIEIFELLKKIKGAYTGLNAETIRYQFQYFKTESEAGVQLEAARGHLVHQMYITQDRIQAYKILAPTEWNFHPQGVLYKMIQTLTYQNEAHLLEQIKLLVNAVDPCVGFSIEIKNA